MNDAGKDIRKVEGELDEERRRLIQIGQHHSELEAEKQRLISEMQRIEKRLEVIKKEETVDMNERHTLENEHVRNRAALEELQRRLTEQSHLPPPSRHLS